MHTQKKSLSPHGAKIETGSWLPDVYVLRDCQSEKSRVDRVTIVYIIVRCAVRIIIINSSNI